MLEIMKFIFLSICLIMSFPVFAGVYPLTHQQWAVPRKAETVLAMPAIRDAVHAMQKDSAARLVLRYPGGDTGTLWVNELKSWLVSLGVPSTKMEIIPGSSKTNIIELEVITSSGVTENAVGHHVFFVVDKETV